MTAVVAPIADTAQLDPLKEPRWGARSGLRLSPRYQHGLAGHRIDIDAHRRRQTIGTAVGAQTGAQVKAVAVPRAPQDPHLRQTGVERPAPMRAYRAMRDDLAILERQDADRCSVDFE